MTANLQAHSAAYKASGEAYATPTPVQVTNIQLNYGTVVSTLATLVADGASPTQAHVTAAANAWAALKTIIDAAVTIHANMVTVTLDATKITDVGMLRAGLNEALKSAVGSGQVTK